MSATEYSGEKAETCARRRPIERILRIGRFGRVYISPLAPLPILCFLLFARDAVVLAGLAAAALHECGHLFVLLLLGGRLSRVEILPFGGEIRAGGELSPARGTAVLLAGIAVNLLCAPAFFFVGRGFLHLFGLCSMGLALFNLLPARGLDGGEILQTLLRRLPRKRSEAILRATSALSASLLVFVFIEGMLASLFNPMLILLALYLLFRAFERA